MLKSHRLKIELHKVQGELAKIGPDGDATKRTELLAEIGELHTGISAALEAEALDVGGEHGNTDPGETAGRRALLGQVGIRDYVEAATLGRPVEGAPAELLESYGMRLVGAEGGTPVPWSVIERALNPSMAYTTTTQNDGSVNQRSYIGRIFARAVAEFLGTRMESVVGVNKFPVVTSGTAVGAKGEGDAADAAVAAGIDENELKPLKVTGRFELSHELDAASPEADAGLALDLIGDARNTMYGLMLTGNGAAPNPTGILQATRNPANAGADVTFADVIGVAAGVVDGRHVAEETEVGVLMNAAAYQKAGELVAANAEYSALDRLRARCRGVMASSLMPAVAANNARVLLHRGRAGGGRSDSIMVLFGGGPEIIRDRYSQASQGVVMTVVALWNFAAVRASNTDADSAYIERRWKVS